MDLRTNLAEAWPVEEEFVVIGLLEFSVEAIDELSLEFWYHIMNFTLSLRSNKLNKMETWLMKNEKNKISPPNN